MRCGLGLMVRARASFLFIIFFFQAEDGIRDLVRSRGLGDVYKRQVVQLEPVLLACTGQPGYPLHLAMPLGSGAMLVHVYAIAPRILRCVAGHIGGTQDAVSYTHLTLPTIDLV